MDDFEENEVFDSVESFLLENYSGDLEQMSGSGSKHNVDSFRDLRKFINLLNDKYNTGLGVVRNGVNIKNMQTK